MSSLPNSRQYLESLPLTNTMLLAGKLPNGPADTIQWIGDGTLPSWLPAADQYVLLLDYPDRTTPKDTYAVFVTLDDTWLVRGSKVFQRCNGQTPPIPGAPSYAPSLNVAGAPDLSDLTAILVHVLGAPTKR